MFDSNLDFWEFLYEKELEKGTNMEDWHIHRKIKNMEDEKNMHEHEKVKTIAFLEQREYVIQKRKNRRIYLDGEKEAFKQAQKFNEAKEKSAKPPAKKIDFIVDELQVYISEKVESLSSLIPLGAEGGIDVKTPDGSDFVCSIFNDRDLNWVMMSTTCN
jgi:hypothetical protein